MGNHEIMLSRARDEIMTIKPNKYGKYPVQICLTKREYDLLRKEAYKVDKTLNQYILAVVQKHVQRK